MAQGDRKARVAEQIQREAAQVLLEEADDPVLRAATVTEVRVSPDLRHARVLFTTAVEQREEADRRARRFEPILQRELARRLRLRYAPEISLRLDEGFEHAMRLEKIFEELKAGREETGEPEPPRPARRDPGPEDGVEPSGAGGREGSGGAMNDVEPEPRDVTEDEAAGILAAGRRVLLGIHRNPDGDAVGSALGLAHVLRGRGADVTCFFADGVPEPFRFLIGADRTVRELTPGPVFDLAVALDCGDFSVLPRSWPSRGRWEKLLVIDHHPVRRPFGDWTYRDTSAPCVGELIVRLADRMGHVLDKPLAEAAYVSLVMDTGFFRYPSVTSQAFRLAARLLDAGVSPWKVAYRCDEDYPANRLPMLVEILGTLRLDAGGAVASLVVLPGLLERLGLPHEYLENVINFARGIRGVEVAAQFRVNDEGKVRVSLRSRGRVDVAELARRHGGGGHHNASGCTLEPPLEAAREKLIAAAAAAVAALPPLDPGDEGFLE